MKKLIIIPAYNESASIVQTAEDMKRNAPDFDYLIINDGSTDKTRQIIESNGLPALHLCHNLGIGGAVQTGYRYARDYGYDLAVQMDGDGQHDPTYLSKMAEMIERGEADLVIGSRFLEKKGFQSSGMRRMGIRFFTRLIYLLTGEIVTDPTSGMRMAGRDVIEMFASYYPEDYPEPESVAAALRSGCRVREIPVTMRERTAGVSSISPGKSVYYMCKVSMAILIDWIRGKERS